MIIAVARIQRGDGAAEVCTEMALQRRNVERLLDAVAKRGLEGLVPAGERLSDEALGRRRQGIAQMLLGTLAEKRFEDITQEVVGAKVVRIEDHRPSRSDTDYRLLNGNDHPICRLNICVAVMTQADRKI